MTFEKKEWLFIVVMYGFLVSLFTYGYFAERKRNEIDRARAVAMGYETSDSSDVELFLKVVSSNFRFFLDSKYLQGQYELFKKDRKAFAASQGVSLPQEKK